MAEDIKTQEPLGYVSAYNVNLRNGIAYLAVTASPRAMGSGSMLRAMGILISYLFENWPFRKLYFETSEKSFVFMASGFRGLFLEEGRLKEFEYTAEGYCDVIVGSISRDSWRKVVPRGLSLSAAAARFGLSNSLILDRVSAHHGSSPSQDILNLDDFLTVIADVAERPRLDPHDSLLEIGLDSLQILELACVIEELSGNSVDLITEVDVQMTLRDLFLLYCEKASSPLSRPQPRQ